MNVYARIGVEQAEALLREFPQALLFDIRMERDFTQAHHPRSVHLNDTILRATLKSQPKDAHVLVCCYHGNSSQEIAQLFADFGFRNAYSVDGGFEAWQSLLEMRGQQGQSAARSR